jgi:hypothetical protein
MWIIVSGANFCKALATWERLLMFPANGDSMFFFVGNFLGNPFT